MPTRASDAVNQRGGFELNVHRRPKLWMKVCKYFDVDTDGCSAADCIRENALPGHLSSYSSALLCSVGVNAKYQRRP